MQRQQRSPSNASTGASIIIVHCGDYKCGHSVTMYPALWQDTVRLSDLGAFRCTVCGHWGACLSRRRRAQTTRFRVRRSFTADNIPCVRSRELFLRRTKKARQREPAGFDVGPALSDTRMPSHLYQIRLGVALW